MSFFGLTSYGVDDYFKFAIRPDYKEPEVQQDLLELVKQGKINRPIHDIKEIDIESGIIDGYAYNSHSRLQKQRRRGFPKAVGPTDIFRYSVTRSMDCGWWIDDPDLKNGNWWLPSKKLPKTCSQITKYVEETLKTDKLFQP